MNDLTTLEAYVTAHPEERTPARALVDAHQELLGVPYPVALRAVARIHRAARQAREMATAASLIREPAPNSASVRAMVMMAAGADDGRPVTIYIVPGRRYPRARPIGDVGDTEGRVYWTINVGALYVIATANGFDAANPGAIMPSWMFPDDDSTD